MELSPKAILIAVSPTVKPNILPVLALVLAFLVVSSHINDIWGCFHAMQAIANVLLPLKMQVKCDTTNMTEYGFHANDITCAPYGEKTSTFGSMRKASSEWGRRMSRTNHQVREQKARQQNNFVGCWTRPGKEVAR